MLFRITELQKSFSFGSVPHNIRILLCFNKALGRLLSGCAPTFLLILSAMRVKVLPAAGAAPGISRGVKAGPELFFPFYSATWLIVA